MRQFFTWGFWLSLLSLAGLTVLLLAVPAALGLALYFGLVRLIDRRRVRERPRPGWAGSVEPGC